MLFVRIFAVFCALRLKKRKHSDNCHVPCHCSLMGYKVILGFVFSRLLVQKQPRCKLYSVRSRSNFRIPRNSFTCHWIRIASIVLCLDLQSLPTHVSEADQSCGVFWSLAQESSAEFIESSRILKNLWSYSLKYFLSKIAWKPVWTLKIDYWEQAPAKNKKSIISLK